jgi:hypothetical protein
MTAKNCLACKRPIKGRTDKKFCDDSCRNNYNNRLNSDITPLMRNINNILRKNRRIIEELLAHLDKKTLVIDRQKLVERGFHFGYCTEHTESYSYCYEYGYRALDSEKILAVKDTRKKALAWEKKQRLVRSTD